MSNSAELNELHWLLAIVQSIDVGVVVLDRDYRVEVWNTFMENRSGLQPENARNRSSEESSRCFPKSMKTGSAGRWKA